jgi:hypothetical protein
MFADNPPERSFPLKNGIALPNIVLDRRSPCAAAAGSFTAFESGEPNTSRNPLQIRVLDRLNLSIKPICSVEKPLAKRFAEFDA